MRASQEAPVPAISAASTPISRLPLTLASSVAQGKADDAQGREQLGQPEAREAAQRTAGRHRERVERACAVARFA